MKKVQGTPAENTETPETEIPAEGAEGAQEGAEGTPSESTEEEENEEESEEGEEGKPKEGDAPPAFVPNFKYKVMDQEKEFDDIFKGAIKTKEDEDKIRDILTKVEGFDAFKSKHSKLEEKHSAFEKEYQEQVIPYVQEVESIKALVAGQTFEQRDYQTFFEKLGIPKDHILRYTKNILDYQDASPEQRAAIDHQRNLQLQARQLEQQSQQFQSQNAQLAVQARTFELNTELTKPEVSSFVAAFDSLHGNGAFRNQVINQGALIFHNQKKDVPASELVKLVMDQFKGIQVVQPQVVPPQNQVLPKPTTPPAKKPVIPNVQGNGGSPAKKVFTSLDEIKAHRKSLRNA